MTNATTLSALNLALEEAPDGSLWVSVLREDLLRTAGAILESSYAYLSVVAGVDRVEHLEVVYIFRSLAEHQELFLRVKVSKGDPHVPSLSDLFRSADWQEREIYDLFGVVFDGHTDLRRILLPDNWVGHPLLKDYQATEGEQDESPGELEPKLEAGENEVLINMGPQHPSTHGVFRMIIKVSGELVEGSSSRIGYLHRGFEKLAERRNYTQYLPYPDRWDYVASILNEMAYVGAVEQRMGLEVPRRADFLRVITMELNRLASHLIWVGTFLLDVGALTPFLYTFREREMIMELLCELTGARMTYNYFRFGGVAYDTPSGFLDKLRDFLAYLPPKIVEYEELITGNEIFLARTKGVGVLDRETALNCGCSGPMLRGSGIRWDLRRDRPYSVYPELEFEIPCFPEGDIYARYLVRMEEMRQSVRILNQAVEMIPAGSVRAKTPRIIKPPAGETYFAMEPPRGELGVFLISDGSDHAFRLKIRAPSFVNLTALEPMLQGQLVADAVAILGSIDILLGEVDR